MTGLIGAIVEAWDELRTHKIRVVLALIGVAVAVCSITMIWAAGSMARQVSTEWNERWGGRPVTLSAGLWSADSVPSHAEVRAAYEQVKDRYSIGYSTMYGKTMVSANLASGARSVMIHTVDVDYLVMHRVTVNEGRWFVAADGDRLSPTLVVNESFMTALGASGLSGRSTVGITSGERQVLATIVGVYPNTWPQDAPEAYALDDAQEQWVDAENTSPTAPSMEFWVPDNLSDTLRPMISADLEEALPGVQADVTRSDTPVDDVVDGAIRWVIIGVSVVALILGALGLINIAMVSVRARVREIGIRRSFGATSGRIFTSVLLESVVATFCAGLIGVAAAILILRFIPLDTLMGQPVEFQPQFPVLAAAVGLGTSVAVGCICGLIPAIVAVRIRVMDAIRA